MTNTNYGGVVSNKGVNLTCIGHGVYAVGTWVALTGGYHVELPAARGDLNVIGYVMVANKVAGEDVSVASRFQMVDTFVAAEAVTAGDSLVAGVDGKLYVYDPNSSPGDADSCCSIVGLALTSAAQGGSFDVGIY